MGDSVEPDQYLEHRIEQYRGWYDRRARSCKRWYLWMRSAALASASSVPVLVNNSGPTLQTVGSAASVLVVVLLALESVLHFREQWKNYRFTEQYLDKERYLYLARAGAYSNLSDEKAFLRLVERAEWAIASENSTTLSTMTLAPEVRANGGV